MTSPRARIRPVTVILVLAILVLGLLVTAQERREARLRSALAHFRNRAHQEIYSSLNIPIIASWMKTQTTTHTSASVTC